MTEMSRRFNFDDFDEQVREALEEHEITPAQLALWGMLDVTRPTRESDVTIEGSPDVIVYDPNQDSLW